MTTPDDDKRPAFIVLTALAATFLLVAIAAFLPQARLWGINHLAYYPVPLRLVLLLLMALSFVPWMARWLARGSMRTVEFVRERRRLRVLALIIGPLLSLAVFWSFQSSTRVLGDGQVIANNLEVPYRGDSTMVVPTLKAIALQDRIAPGATMLFYLAGVARLRTVGGEPVEAQQMVSCVLGGLLVLLILAVIVRGPGPPLVALWLLVCALSSGAMELFFGYVENYAPLLVLGALYASCGLRRLGGGGGMLGVTVAFIAAAYAHVSGVLLAPSMAMLLWFVWRKKASARSANRVTLSLLALTVIATAVAALTPLGGRFFVPLHGTEYTYGFFSTTRWADIGNELLLLMPLSLVFAAMGFALLVERPRATPGQNTSGRSTWHFVALITVPQLLYILFFNPEIGMGRDWDLFTSAVIGLVPLGVIVTGRFASAHPRVMSLITIPSLVIALVVGAAWIGINASFARSTERFEHILDHTKSRRDYAYEVLAKTYYDRGMLADAIRAMEKASAISQNPRHYFTLSSYYRKYGDIAAAREILRRTLVRRPAYLPARQDYVSLLFAMKDYEGALEAAREGLEYNPRLPFFHLYIGKSLARMNRPDEARQILLQGRALGGDGDIPHEIDQELRRLAGH